MTKEEERYNGWTNIETWATYSWLTNDADTHFQARVQCTPDELKELVDSFWDSVRNGNLKRLPMLEDIGSTWRVDWAEVFAALHE